MNFALSPSKERRLLRLLKPQNPSISILLRHFCSVPLPQPPKQDNKAIEATVNLAIELLNQTPQQNWASSQPLQTLIYYFPNFLPRITRRLLSHSEALNFFNLIRTNPQLQNPQCLHSTFQALLEVTGRGSGNGERLLELYRKSKEWKIPITINAAAILIRELGREEMIDKSVLIYNEIDPSLKNTHLRNVLIRALLESGRVDDALKVLDEMLQPNSEAKPNSITGNTFFNELMKQDHRKGRFVCPEEIVELVLKFGKFSIFPSNVMLTTLLSILCKKGKFNPAWDFLNELMNLRVPLEASCFNVVLTELGKNGNMNKMNILLKEMKERDVNPNIVTIGILINQLCKLRRVDEAIEVFKMLREGTDGVSIVPDVVSYNTLIDGLCKVGRQEEGLAMMEQMRSESSCTPTTSTYNCLIDGFCKGGELEKGRELFDRMKDEGVKPNVITFNTLIDGMCRYGKIGDGLKFFDEMKGEGVSPNAVTYTTLINAYCNVNNIDKAFELFDQMLSRGCSVDAILYYTLISGLCNAGRIDDASIVLSKMKQDGFRPDNPCYNVLISSLCKANRINDAFTLITEMEGAGMKANAVTYNALIAYFSETGKFPTALRVKNRMMREGLQPTSATYGTLIQAFCVNGRIDDALQVFGEMKAKSIILPNTNLYNVLIESLCGKNEVDEAITLMNDMTVNEVRPNAATYNAVFRGLRKKNSLEEAFRLMDRMIMEECCPDCTTLEILSEWLSSVGEIEKLRTFSKGFEVSPAAAAAR